MLQTACAIFSATSLMSTTMAVSLDNQAATSTQPPAWFDPADTKSNTVCMCNWMHAERSTMFELPTD